ncbi:RNA-directed DNA polymerase, partial [Vibrio cholerae]|uniref:RNA-directed DNA polymerase n=1 Tax=Vibrio cholerae TaxID=666 RepID=UPI002A24F2FF
MKHTLKVKGYVRYMDDLFILSNSPEKLQEWKEHIEWYLTSRLQLKLHPTKVHLSPIEEGFDYLGFRVFPHYKHVRKT